MSKGSKTQPLNPATPGPVTGLDNPLDRVPETFGPTELELVWEKYRGLIIGAVVVVLVTAIGYNVWLFQKQAQSREAQQRFAAAKSEPDFKQIAQDFPGQPVGGNALMMLAADQVEKEDFKAARATYEELVQKFPEHPLVPAALYAIAGLQENEGKLDEALARYKEIVKTYPDSFVEDASLRGEARVLVAKGDLDGARGVYQQILGKAEEKSPARESAEDELKLLNRQGEEFTEIKYVDPNPMPAAPDGNSPFPMPSIPGVPSSRDGLGIPEGVGTQGNTLNIGSDSTPEEIKNILESAMQNAAGDATTPGVPALPEVNLPEVPPAPSIPMPDPAMTPTPEPTTTPAPAGESTPATPETTGTPPQP